jgi:uncharacterized protein (DUF342 family)
MANTVIAKGTASISVNPQETEAKLIFTPDPEGLGWDLDALNKLTMETGLSPPPSPKLLEPFLQKASRTKDKNPMELLLYQGTAPEEPVPETVAWEDLPVPADMAPYQAEIAAKAPAPQLFKIRIEKIKKESIVKKPGPLPFLPSKEEVVVSWEKKETKEAVTVNPEPRQIMYAGRGKKLGTLSPPKPGKPGKSVFGKPLPPAAGGESGFLFGAGISREKNDATALYSGFLRIGENWADIIPLSKPSYNVTIGADGLTPFFNFTPGDSRFPLPSGDEVLAEALSKEVNQAALVDPKVLDEAMREAARSGEPVEAFPLFAAREAEARVDINQDQTKAVLYLRKGVAGALLLEMKTINQAIKDSGVAGFDGEKLKAALKIFMESKEIELKDYVLAEGSPSTRGKDREVQLGVTPLADEVKKPLLERLKGLPKGARGGPLSLAPEEATALALVAKGAVVAQVTSSSEGEAGKDIFGNVIPGLPGNDPDLKLFRGLEQHGAKIIAAQEGLLLVKAEEKSFRGEVLDYRDGKVVITISDDAMEVRGDLTGALGAGAPLTVEKIQKELAALGVNRGIDREAVERARQLAHIKGSVSGQILARGEAPVAKGGMGIKWHVAVDPAAPLMPAKGVQVKVNSLIAEITGEEKEGKKGYDVKGTEIPSDQGAALRIGHDDSIKELPASAQGGAAEGKRLVAERAGELFLDGETLKIKTLQGIEGDVGPATGNVNFPGDIKIAGGVLPGYSVIAGRSVLVACSAEACLISSGGRVIVTQGIKGQGKGVIRARNTIETAFVEKATLMAVEDIRVKIGCALCTIKTNGKLFIASDKGKLVGGVCQARRGIDTGDIGSERGGRTEIFFGQDYLVKDQIEMTEEEISKVRSALIQIDERIKQAQHIPSSLESARAEKVRLLKLLEQLNLKVFTLREKFEEHHESEIRIRGTIYPGVVIESHDRYYEIKQTRSQVVFFFDREDGRIREKSLDAADKAGV